MFDIHGVFLYTGNMNLSFDINIFVSTKQSYRLELTENYEGHKYHIVVYDYSTTPAEHIDTQGFDNEKEVFNYIRSFECKHELDKYN